MNWRPIDNCKVTIALASGARGAELHVFLLDWGCRGGARGTCCGRVQVASERASERVRERTENL